jgi:hypothetical protein
MTVRTEGWQAVGRVATRPINLIGGRGRNVFDRRRG